MNTQAFNHPGVATALLLGSLAGVGCGSAAETSNAQPASRTPPMAEQGRTMPSATGTTATAAYDLRFIDAMTDHHQGAIEMATLADGRDQHKELKALAAQIVDDQQRQIVQMKAWRHEWYGDATKAESTDMPGMAGSMTDMDMNHMKSMSGTGFDLMFIDMMIPHHQGAVAMANDALSKAEHAEVKALARKIIDAQQKEIGMMTTWKAAWSDTK